MGSDNPRGAENQQERPVGADWIVGFVDGEGCFSIGFVRQPSRRSRKGYKTGYQVAHSFVVVQGARSIGVLEQMQCFFGVGAVSVNRRHDNHKEDLHRYIVSRREDLLRVIIPFFEANPLRTAKRDDFEKFQVRQDLPPWRTFDARGADRDRRNHGDHEPQEIQERPDRNPQRPYAERPGHGAKRWSQLHGDMQGQHFSRKGAVRSAEAE
jgi:hypothetical protein